MLSAGPLRQPAEGALHEAQALSEASEGRKRHGNGNAPSLREGRGAIGKEKWRESDSKKYTHPTGGFLEGGNALRSLREM